MLTRLKHTKFYVYVDLNEITLMEREIRPNTTLIVPGDRVYMTQVTLKNGKSILVENTPEQILEMIDKSNDGELLLG